MRKGEIPLSEEVIEELKNHKKIDGKRKEKEPKKIKRNKSKVIIKNSIIIGKSAGETGVDNDDRDSAEEAIAKKAWLKQQKAEGKDTVATKFVEIEIEEQKNNFPKGKDYKVLAGDVDPGQGQIYYGDIHKKEIEAAHSGKKENQGISKQGKPEILEHFGSDYGKLMREEIKEETSEDAAGEKQPEKTGKIPKVFSQKHLTDEYLEALGERQEMEEFAKKPAPELQQEFLEKNEEAMRNEDETALEKLRAENKELYDLSKKESGLIEELDRKNSELKTKIEKLEANLKAMEAETEKQAKEFKDPTRWEKVKKFFGSKKVQGAIIFGLVGAGAYAASGGTAVPVYFALQKALAAKGISFFVPAAAGHGLSTWGSAAALGGFTGYLSEKLGIFNRQKSDRSRAQESFEKIKNVGTGEMQVKKVKSGEEKKTETESAPKTEEAKGGMAELKLPVEETKKKKPPKTETSKIDIVGGKLEKREELTPEQKKEILETAEKHGIDVIGAATGGQETKDESELEKLLKDEAEKFKSFIEDFKNKKKDGKDIFEYLNKLARLYCKDSSKYANIFDAEIRENENRHSRNPDEIKVALIDSMVDYLRENNRNEERKWAKQLTTILFPWYGAKTRYTYAGKKENVEWLGWKKYEVSEK